MSDPKFRRPPRESAASAGAASEPLSAAEPESSAPALPPPHSIAEPIAAEPLPQTAERAAPDLFAYGREAWAAFAEAQAAAARGFEGLVGEIASLARSEMTAAAESATALFGVKSLADAVEINLGFARRSFDAMIGSSAKLSEIGVKAAVEASRPLLARLGGGWKAAGLG
jgi:hypothetical protein